jgi:hypothetical protein
MKLAYKWMLGAVLTSSLVGCGGGGKEGKVVNSFSFAFQDGKAAFSVLFSPDFTLNMENRSPVGKYGEIAFVPGTTADYGFKFDASLNVGAYLDATINRTKVTRLPNGAPFPSYIGSSLSRYEFVNKAKFSGNVYFGSEVGKRYLGTAVALNFLSDNIPSGIALSQSLYNAKNERVGVATVYGPVMDQGGMVAPGGLFGAINLSTTVPGIEDKISGKAIQGDLESLVANQKFEAAGDYEVWTADGRTLTEEQMVDFLIAFKRALQSAPK